MMKRLPLQFRVLYRQFLLRVVDLEALSMQANVTQLLGQFAGVLILISAFRTIGFLWMIGRPDLSSQAFLNYAMEDVLSFIAGTMLVVGLLTVVSWDAIFPDRRDVLVLGPLPVKPVMILTAKLAASGALLVVAIVALNFAMGTVLPFVTGGTFLGILRVLFAWWFTMGAATLFLYGGVVAVQGWTSLLLPRRRFLQLSALLQLAAFALFLAGWIFQPSLADLAGKPGHPEGRWPACWFLCLALQLDGKLPTHATWLAQRAWIALGISLAAAGTSLLLSYLKTMKKTIEEPDLLPGGTGKRTPMRWGDELTTAIVQFSLRSLIRSKQHRVIYAFFLAITFAIGLSTLKDLVTGGVQQLTPGFLIATQVMICLSIIGVRSVFSLPVSLKANWVLQITQLHPPEKYIAATRRAMLVMSAGPVWLVTAALSLGFRPWNAVVEHLVVLALLASIMTDLCLISVSKIPFACSYLPGKSNVQYVFWAFAVGFVPIAMHIANEEVAAFASTRQLVTMLTVLATLAVALWAFNRSRSKHTVLYYEETEPEVITTLGLSGMLMQD